MNKANRITLNMNLSNAITVMSDGNPGALTAMMELVKSDGFGLIDLCHLDDMGLYGSDIWIGYKDVCNFDVVLFRQKIRDRSIEADIKVAQ